MRKAFLLFIAVSSLISCSKEFQREDAEQLILTEFKYPLIEFRQCSFYNEENLSTRKNILKGVNITGLIEKNVFRFRRITKRGTFSSSQYNKYDLTSKGSKLILPGSKLVNDGDYISGYFPIHLIKFDSVTGLKFNNAEKTSVTINYKIKYSEKTPFRELSKLKMQNRGTEYSVNAELYDDGWRLENKKSDMLIPLSDFQNWGILGNVNSDSSELNEFNISSIITNETTEYDCLIRKVYEKEGYKLVEVDFVQLKSEEKEGGIEYYKIVNTNPKLRTFLISNNSRLQPNLNFGDLSKYETKTDEGQLFYIKTENGEISELIRNDAG